MQRKRFKRNSPAIRKSDIVRSGKGRFSIRKPAGEKANTQKVIADGIFALTLSDRHPLEIYPKVDGRFHWHRVDSPNVILNQIIPAYKRTMELLGCEPNKIKSNNPFDVEKIISDINDNWKADGHPVSLHEISGEYKLVYREELSSNEQFNIIAYKEVMDKLSGKYRMLFDRSIHTLIKKLSINDWMDMFSFYRDSCVEDMYEGDEDLMRQHDDAVFLYEQGEVSKAYDRVLRSKILTDKYLKRYDLDNHPVSSFARDVFELAAVGKNVYSYDSELNEADDGLAFHEQFLICYEFDDIFSYHEELINNMANEGIKMPVKEVELTADIKSLPVCGDDNFTFKLYKFFDKWATLAQKIDNKNQLVNILT